MFTDTLPRVVKACFWPPLRTAALLLTGLITLELLGPWVIGASAGSVGVLAAVVAPPPILTPTLSVVNVVSDSAADRAGLRPGDAILAVDGLRVFDMDVFYRALSGRRPGDEVVLRIQPGGGGAGRQASEPARDVSLTLLPLSTALKSAWFYEGFPWPSLAIIVPAIVVAFARPREPAARLLLVACFALGLSFGLGLWPGIEVFPDIWTRLNMVGFSTLSTLACLTILHLFLVFPLEHPLARRMRSWGPASMRRFGGLLGLLYVLPVLAGASPLTYALPLGSRDVPPGVILQAIRNVLGLWSLPTGAALLVVSAVVLAQSYGRAETALVRAQVKWILWGTAMLAGFVLLGLVSVVLQATALVPYSNWNAMPLLVLSYVLPLSFPLGLGIAILRFHLLDIDFIINRTVVYGVMTIILGTLFLLGSPLAQGALEAATGQRSDLTTSAAALAAVVAYRPVHRRTRRVVDRFLPPRQVLVLLFTDIVGSTERAVQLGDERWREALETYRSAVRRELKRFGGKEVNTAGDSFFATFNGAVPGVRCGQSIATGLSHTGLATRVGLHLGECEMRGEEVSGVNLHVAARVMSLAGAGQVLISETLCEWLSDAGFAFDEHGVHQLKGVPGEWRIYAVTGT